LKGFSLGGVDHSRAPQILNFLSTSLNDLPLAREISVPGDQPRRFQKPLEVVGVTHGNSPFVPWMTPALLHSCIFYAQDLYL
jgi:hypothetical protein